MLFLVLISIVLWMKYVFNSKFVVVSVFGLKYDILPVCLLWQDMLRSLLARSQQSIVVKCKNFAMAIKVISGEFNWNARTNPYIHRIHIFTDSVMEYKLKLCKSFRFLTSTLCDVFYQANKQISTFFVSFYLEIEKKNNFVKIK